MTEDFGIEKENGVAHCGVILTYLRRLTNVKPCRHPAGTFVRTSEGSMPVRGPEA